MNSVELYLFEMPSPCRIDGCDRPIKNKANRLCDPHYKRLWRHGDPLAGGPLRENITPPKPIQDFPDGTRLCNRCEQRLPIESFHLDVRGKSGRRGTCADCHSAQVRGWYAANRERQKERQTARRNANIEKYRQMDTERYERDREKRIELATQHSHKRRLRMLAGDYDHTVTRANLRKQYGDHCFYCQRLMDFGRYKRGETPDHLASLEHVHPISRGGTHTWDNVVLACLRCNLQKNAKLLSLWDGAA